MNGPEEQAAARSALAMDPDTFRTLGYRMVDALADRLTTMRDHPVFTAMTADERRALLESPMPAHPTPPEEVWEDLHQVLRTFPMINGSPRFFGWVNSPPAPLAILAEMMAAGLNVSCAGGDHPGTYIEHRVVRQLMELVGFPVEGSMGLLVSGGSMASLTCLAAARHWAATRAGWNVRAEGMQTGHAPLVMYVSTEGHSCIQKAAEVLGLGSERGLRRVPVDADLRMDISALRTMPAADRAAGMQPFCVAASAGTVNTGIIDPLDDLADLCAEEDLWLHVDGAYGAVGVLDERIAARYSGMERVHSLALDPHKWFSVPVECGCALVRDGNLLRDAFSLVPPYLRIEEGKGFGGLPWFSEYGMQQTRGFRALKLWAVLQQAGIAGLAAQVSRHNDLARYLATLIDEAADFERLAPVTLSVVCFRYVPDSHADDDMLNRLNKTLMEEIQRGGQTFLTSTELSGRFALRACVLHYETNEQDLIALIGLVRAAGVRLTR
jgi:aromatic-L-amino-acid/L-tryptophan decarboxylase